MNFGEGESNMALFVSEANMKHQIAMEGEYTTFILLKDYDTGQHERALASTLLGGIPNKW